MRKKKIAIIGSGISGLTTAYLTYSDYEITVYESASRLGGHTATVDITHLGVDYTIDTGFIVFNEKTYPNFNRLLETLKVEKVETWMGFGVSNKEHNLEFNTSGFRGFFAQRRKLFSISHWLFLLEILRFNRQAKNIAVSGLASKTETIATFVEKNKYSKFFIDNYLVPLTAIVWSQDKESILDMPLHFFLSFFHNHGLFSKGDLLKWFVVKSNSRSYIEPMIGSFENLIKTDTHIQKIYKYENGVEVAFIDGSRELFDEVVLATHSDIALNLLDDTFKQEHTILSLMPYSKHEVVLHTDESLMPKSSDAWEAWNIQVPEKSKVPIFTYWMNLLQGIAAPINFFVSLDPVGEIIPEKVLHTATYSHPIFSVESVRAQGRWSELQGQNHVWFAGAYWRNGFHEDGVWSGIRVAKALGADISVFKDTYKE